ARYLGPVIFGHLASAASFAGLFTGVATLGLDALIIRDLAREPEQRDAVLGTAFCLMLVAGIAVLLVIFGATFTTPTRAAERALHGCGIDFPEHRPGHGTRHARPGSGGQLRRGGADEHGLLLRAARPDGLALSQPGSGPRTRRWKLRAPSATRARRVALGL